MEVAPHPTPSPIAVRVLCELEDKRRPNVVAGNMSQLLISRMPNVCNSTIVSLLKHGINLRGVCPRVWSYKNTRGHFRWFHINLCVIIRIVAVLGQDAEGWFTFITLDCYLEIMLGTSILLAPVSCFQPREISYISFNHGESSTSLKMPKAFLSQVQGLLKFERKLIWRAPGITMENENRKTLKPEKSPELSYRSDNRPFRLCIDSWHTSGSYVTLWLSLEVLLMSRLSIDQYPVLRSFLKWSKNPRLRTRIFPSYPK